MFSRYPSFYRIQRAIIQIGCVYIILRCGKYVHKYRENASIVQYTHLDGSFHTKIRAPFRPFITIPSAILLIGYKSTHFRLQAVLRITVVFFG